MDIFKAKNINFFKWQVKSREKNRILKAVTIYI